MLEVILGGTADRQEFLSDGFRKQARGQVRPAREVGARARGRVGLAGGRRPGEDHAAAVDPGPRPHLQEVVRRQHHVPVVLDHHDGVAEVAQPVDRADQPKVVGRV